MSTLSIQSDRSALDHDAIDREFSEKKALYDNTALGISLRGQNIYFTEIEKKGGGFLARKFGAIATTIKFGSGVEGVEKNLSELYSYINGCLEDNAIVAKRFSLSINTQLATVHKTFVEANSTEQEFENFIKWEFGKQILDDPDQFVVNTVNLRSVGETSKIEPVLIVGLRRRFVETLSQVLEKAKIDLTCLDVDILCSHAAYEINYEPFSEGMTALVEIKPGVVSILLCDNYEVEYVYQFTTSAKSSAQKVATLLNFHLDAVAALYGQLAGKNVSIGRTILCNEMAASAQPFVESRFRPVTINPFEKIRLPQPFAVESSDEEKEEKELPPPVDYSPYAECVGAAIKLLTP
jgi:Tfp pilus assembly PilM family ATPase